MRENITIPPKISVPAADQLAADLPEPDTEEGAPRCQILLSLHKMSDPSELPGRSLA